MSEAEAQARRRLLEGTAWRFGDILCGVSMASARNLDLITLPLRTMVLLVLLWFAYYLGYGSPLEEWRRESPETGVVARYTRNNRPWRVFHDRDRDRQWDMWIDERGGPPLIVSIDDDGDGRPDREEDEFGNAIPPWRGSWVRARKTAVEFFHNPRQLQYAGLAVMLYTLLELAIRSMSAGEKQNRRK